MIQDIEPYEFNNLFINARPAPDDRIIIIKDKKLLVKISDDRLDFPRIREIKEASVKAGVDPGKIPADAATYLFSINNKTTGENNRFFWYDELPDEIIEAELAEGCELVRQRRVQYYEPRWLGFAGTTAYHICSWYHQNTRCGICGREMKRSRRERKVSCEYCGTHIYPRINPVVIVAVTDGDKLLLTKYAHNEYKKYALVAGFAEVGETIEQTVQREVHEETGLYVKNLKFYKSQPWALSQSLLFGFFCEVNGSRETHLIDGELSVAEWVSREDIPRYDDTVSLTQEMIHYFIDNGSI